MLDEGYQLAGLRSLLENCGDEPVARMQLEGRIADLERQIAEETPPRLKGNMIETLHKGRHLTLLSNDGWEYVERNGNQEVVAVVATTAQNEILIIEQFRKPIGQTILEIPAGLVDPGETPEVAARRELLEETGYSAAFCNPIDSGFVSSGLTNEKIHLWRALNVTQVARGGGIDGEKITVHKIPLNKLAEWLDFRVTKDNCALSLQLLAGFYAAAASSGR